MSDDGTPASRAQKRTAHLKICSSRASLVMTILRKCSAFGMSREVTPQGQRASPARPNLEAMRARPLPPLRRRYYREAAGKSILQTTWAAGYDRIALAQGKKISWRNLSPADLVLRFVITRLAAINAVVLPILSKPGPVVGLAQGAILGTRAVLLDLIAHDTFEFNPRHIPEPLPSPLWRLVSFCASEGTKSTPRECLTFLCGYASLELPEFLTSFTWRLIVHPRRRRVETNSTLQYPQGLRGAPG